MTEGTTSEPSIEEILASIRKIISDDDGEAEKQEPHEANDHRQEETGDDVLELTDVVEDPKAEESHYEEHHAAPESAPVSEIHPLPDLPQAIPMTNDHSSDHANAPHHPPEDGSIITDRTMAVATGAFAKLSHETEPPERTTGDGRTVEDITRELLRPMLREWMDQNLAQIVERLVERELRKITRKAEDL